MKKINDDGTYAIEFSFTKADGAKENFAKSDR
jgi:hypothetical protein